MQTASNASIAPAMLAGAAIAAPSMQSGYPTYQPGYTSHAEKPAASFVRRRGLELLLVGLIALLGVGAVIFGAVFLLAPKHSAGSVKSPSVASSQDRKGGSSMFGAVVDANGMDARLARAGATTGGDLEVSLAWNSLSDLDLEVCDQSGEWVWADHPHGTSGGEQDVDENPTLLNIEGSARAAAMQKPGVETMLPIPEYWVDMDKKLDTPPDAPGMGAMPSFGGKATSRFTRTPVEHIFWANAPKGTFTINVHCYCWREASSSPLPFTVIVRSHGKVVLQKSGVIGPANFVADGALPIQVCRYEVR